ncbi:MAG: hypothetical protein H6708_10870 [Kofleriaceae bacterium]|nr:hypothetical protein [Kofleriaceae bacterium]
MTAGAWRPALLGVAVGLAIGACMQRAPTPMPGWEVAHERRNEIALLSTQIRDWRREAGMSVEPAAAWVLQARPMDVRTAKAVCPPSHHVSATCGDVCDLADAICDNAESICSIAGELGDDAWAKDKCDSAKASCREAKQRCCACDAPTEP